MVYQFFEHFAIEISFRNSSHFKPLLRIFVDTRFLNCTISGLNYMIAQILHTF